MGSSHFGEKRSPRFSIFDAKNLFPYQRLYLSSTNPVTQS
jgi:hypothetical protein